MVHTLCPVASIIDDDSESAWAFFLAKLLGHIHHVTKQCLLVFASFRELTESGTVFGDHQKVHGRLWIDVSKGDAQLVVVDLVGQNASQQDLVKNRGWRWRKRLQQQGSAYRLRSGPATRLQAAAAPCNSQIPIERAWEVWLC